MQLGRLITLASLLSLGGCGQLEYACNAECVNSKAEIQSLKSQLAVAEERIEALEAAKVSNDQRIAAAEANVNTLFDKRQSSPGGWIIWETLRTIENPGRILFSTPKPKPLAAYESQSACAEDAMKTAKTNGGNAEAGTFLTKNESGVVWQHTYSCLPKGIDPR